MFLSALKTMGTFVSMRALWLIRISDVAAAHDEPKITRRKWGCDTANANPEAQYETKRVMKNGENVC